MRPLTSLKVFYVVDRKSEGKFILTIYILGKQLPSKLLESHPVSLFGILMFVRGERRFQSSFVKMGACASVPKGMRAEAMSAPPPEQRKEEETTTTTAPEVVEVTEDGDNAKPKEDEKVADDKHQSLGSLLNESEAAKESAKDEKSSDIKESKGEELPVSNAAAEASS